MKNRKSVRTLAMMVAAIMIVGSVTGCGAKKEETTEKVTTTVETEKIEESTIQDMYTGIEDVYVLQDAKDVNFLAGVLYDDTVVKDIKCDSSKVDTSKEGTYKVTYDITIDREAWEKYRATKKAAATEKTSTETAKVDKKATVVNKEKAQELADNDAEVKAGGDKTVKKTDGTDVAKEQTAPASTEKTDGKTVDASTKKEVKVSVKKNATVVNKDEAQKLADQNKVVKSDGDTTVKKSDGSEVKAEETAPASTTATNGGSANASNKQPANPTATAEPTPEAPSNGGGSSSNNGGGSAGGSSAPAHTHSWTNITSTVNHPAQTHEEPVYETQSYVVKDAWTEYKTVPAGAECVQCGYRTKDPNDMDDHCFENAHSSHNIEETQTIYHDAEYGQRQVQTGTRTVVDKAAWTETVVTGQKCSGCGATK